MNLYLIRHAQAEVVEAGQPDENRKLTLKGHEQAKTLRRSFEQLGVHLDAVYTSPWRRARQTASALEPVAHHLEVMPALAAAPDAALLKAIHAFGHNEVALVGHQPWMSELASMVLTKKRDLATKLEFRKCAVYAFELQSDHVYLRFVLPAGVLKRLS
jgi:phosphohistidine phosphatase